ncbi:teneurin-m [Caerostris extrusa]|uniref:Teneurin-m n=1 Tax=Caerostris extrusa TaxID=172846 RepID=A0AAV4R884_CAEEX|nr:teneurin-m [Caerostris extrusa]
MIIGDALRQMSTKAGYDVGVETVNCTYTPDGYLSEVTGRRNYRFLYDVNGNMKTFWEDEHQVTLKYDDGDRLIGYNDLDLYEVDVRGFLVRKGQEKIYLQCQVTANPCHSTRII